MGAFFANRKEIKGFRKKLRNNATSAEAALWNLIKNKKLNGLKFRRQHSLGKYIVDFYCSSERLIIELDGNPHGLYSRIEKDQERDDFLLTLGYKILRFENRFVFQDPDFVLAEILKILTTKDNK